MGTGTTGQPLPARKPGTQSPTTTHEICPVQPGLPTDPAVSSNPRQSSPPESPNDQLPGRPSECESVKAADRVPTQPPKGHWTINFLDPMTRNWLLDPDFFNAFVNFNVILLNDIISCCNLNNSNLGIKPVNCYPGVVNLSDKVLSPPELSLLSKGLTFVDTPDSPDMGILSEDHNKFHLSIKRHLALGKITTPIGNSNTSQPIPERLSPETPFGNPKFRNPSKWNPQGPMIAEHMSLLNQEQIVDNHVPRKNLKFNLTKEERSAKRSLSSNNHIIIKKADKGSVFVIQNHSDYITEGLRQLSDHNFYRLQEENLIHIHNTLISDQEDRMVLSKEISQKTADYLILETTHTSNFYLLPKIHKNKIPPPGRPIVSANGCPSERISQFVDHFIQPLVQKLPSYLRDSYHLINILRDLRLPENAILASLDITSLYTNIPNHEGIQATGAYLFRHMSPHQNPTNASICKLLELVLTTNNFLFDNKEYLQIGGTAMGIKLAPSFANLFMGHFEDKFVYSYPLQPFIWKRFIDDIIFVWTYGQDELDKFVNHLNTCHDTIQFTLETSC